MLLLLLFIILSKCSLKVECRHFRAQMSSSIVLKYILEHNSKPPPPPVEAVREREIASSQERKKKVWTKCNSTSSATPAAAANQNDRISCTRKFTSNQVRMIKHREMFYVSFKMEKKNLCVKREKKSLQPHETYVKHAICGKRTSVITLMLRSI